MRTLLLKFTIALLFAPLLLIGCGKSTETSKAEIRITTPTLIKDTSTSTFQDLQGKPIELSDYLGKKVLLNYWATWCVPCIREIPSLNRAATILGDDEFIVLLASDESIADINEFLLDHNDFSGNFIKLNSFFASSGVEAVPSTILYGKDGIAIKTWLGEYQWDSIEALTALQNPE